MPRKKYGVGCPYGGGLTGGRATTGRNTQLQSVFLVDGRAGLRRAGAGLITRPEAGVTAIEAGSASAAAGEGYSVDLAAVYSAWAACEAAVTTPKMRKDGP